MPLDWAVLVAYGAGMLLIGWYYASKTKSAEDYLLGGRRMRSSSVGLSLFATLFSTITYLGLPGEMIKHGPVILWSVMAIPIAYLVVGYLLIPCFMRLRVVSAYEILEARLGIHLRLAGSLMFLVTRMFWMALIIYITADKIIVTTMGWDTSATPWVAAVIGLVTVAYTSLGGLRAVVLTDVIQSIILLSGAVLCVVLISIRMGGLSWWPTQWSPTWSHQPVFSLDPRVRVTVVGSIVSMTVWWICTAGSDQMAIQRYLATRDVPAARRVFLVTGLANILITLFLGSLGFALLGLFRAHPELLAAGMDITQEKTADAVFPYFIVRFLPAGITGLVLAALLAAAMSSLSSGINSACSVIGSDFIGRFRAAPPAEAHSVRQVRLIALFSGLAAVLLSVLVGQVGGNIMEVTVRTNHVFVAPLFGLFFMALFVPFATGFGAACGALAGCAVAVVFAYWDFFTGDPDSKLSFQWISLISLVVDMAVAIPLSLVSRRSTRQG